MGCPDMDPEWRVTDQGRQTTDDCVCAPPIPVGSDPEADQASFMGHNGTEPGPETVPFEGRNEPSCTGS